MSDCQSLTSLLIVDLDGESLYTEAPGDSGEVILITELFRDSGTISLFCILLDCGRVFCVTFAILVMFTVELTELLEDSLTLISIADSVWCTFVLFECTWGTELRPGSC